MHRAGRGRALLRVALAVLGVLWGVSARADSAAYSEYEIKAAFILNFARLIEWPAAAFDGEQAPLIVAVLGDDPFEGALETVVDGRAVGTHPIEIRRLRELDDVRGCHIVFVSSPEPIPVPRIVAALDGQSVLLVGDSEEFARRGGTISFFHEEGKVRFAVNRRAAESAGLKISSRMLRLAKLVPDGTSAKPLDSDAPVVVDAAGRGLRPRRLTDTF